MTEPQIGLFPVSTDQLQKKTAAKGEVLLRPGQFARHAYLVSSGCLKSYVIDESGKQHILQFAPEGWYITDINSLFKGEKAIVFIDAVEDAEFFVFDKSGFDHPEAFSNDVLIKGITALQNNLIASNKRLIHLLSSPAEVRYQDFLDTYPLLAQRLPLKLIAAYLGITPEFVSRIRKRKSNPKPSIS